MLLLDLQPPLRSGVLDLPSEAQGKEESLITIVKIRINIIIVILIDILRSVRSSPRSKALRWLVAGFLWGVTGLKVSRHKRFVSAF